MSFFGGVSSGKVLQPQKFEIIALVARRREHVRIILMVFFAASLPPERGALLH